jgi:hypothetical protein
MNLLKAKRRIERMKERAEIGSDARWALMEVLGILGDECSEQLIDEELELTRATAAEIAWLHNREIEPEQLKEAS